MGFSVQFPSKHHLIQPFVAIKELGEYVRISFGGPTATAIFLDATHVSITCVEWVCSVIEGTIPSGYSACFRVASLLRVLDMSKNDDTVTFSIDPDSDTVGVQLDNGDVDIVINIYDNDIDSMDKPEMGGDEIVLDMATFGTRIKDISLLDDTVALRLDNSKVELAASGDIGKAVVKLQTSSAPPGSSDTSQKFALRYIVSILKAGKLFESLSLILSEGMPLCMKMKSEYVSIEFFLAPKVNDSDEED
jgi:hypothetical protein